MKEFHAQIAVAVGEQLKGMMDISPHSLNNALDGEQTLQAELLCNPVPNWS